MENRENELMDAAIRVENLSVSFAGKAVLSNLSLEIPEGGPTFLLGRSGSGKTTFLRAINRLNECFPGCETRGRVLLRLGSEWAEAYAPGGAVEDLRRRVGMVFQTPNVLPLSVARNICMPLKVSLSLSAGEAEARMEQSLREAQLWNEVKDRLNDPAATLSGGQQQRLCLARALALKPDILLLDEPTASLDFKAAQLIEELLVELKSRYTLVVVSHGLGQARRLAEHLFVLHDGGRVEALERDVFRDKDALLAIMDDLL
jgi:phosphate transport system ATP-binding protein